MIPHTLSLLRSALRSFGCVQPPEIRMKWSYFEGNLLRLRQQQHGLTLEHFNSVRPRIDHDSRRHRQSRNLIQPICLRKLVRVGPLHDDEVNAPEVAAEASMQQNRESPRVRLQLLHEEASSHEFVLIR